MNQKIEKLKEEKRRMVQQSTMTDAMEPEDKKSLLRAMISSIEI